EIVVVIGPDAEMRRNENGLDDDRGVEVIQETGVSRDQGPVGGVDQLAALVAVADQAKRIPGVACEQLDHRGEVQIGVRRVNHEYSARFEVAHVESEGLFGKEMHGDSVPGKGVHRENIELLGWFRGK